jgi:hypothetical protein
LQSKLDCRKVRLVQVDLVLVIQQVATCIERRPNQVRMTPMVILIAATATAALAVIAADE